MSEVSRHDLALMSAAVATIAIIYLLASHFTYAVGFPLDDSWIHQTYARNLALRGEWAFRPGTPSAGSTSPLWSALLALGYLLHLSPYVWTYFLGMLTLLGLAMLCEWAGRRLVESYRPRYPWIGWFVALEWHFAWAGMSGMETLLHGLVITTVLILLMTDSTQFLSLGLLTGLSVWIRPDGLTLIGPVLLLLYLGSKGRTSGVWPLIRYLIGFGSLFVPYLLFNLALGGTPMPNTFYAKQAEYISWQQLSIFTRVGQMLLQLIVGPSLVLVPGVVGWLIKAVRQKMWGTLSAFLWCGGYIGLYITRLPVYQHGRYIMPAMPVFFLFGLLAFAEFDKNQLFARWHWNIRTIWRASAGLLALSFIWLGARSYAQDVRIIESEMVVTARWVAVHVPRGALVAAHDIGALGYFDDHELIDLAGLVSPEVIPFIRDEPRLRDYLNLRGANYLVAFPDFYPLLTRDASVVFVTNSLPTLALGRNNMAVYLWKTP